MFRLVPSTDEDPFRYFRKRSQTISDRAEAVWDGTSNTQVYGEVRYDEAGQVWRYVEDTEEIILITDEDAAHYGISGQGSLPEGVRAIICMKTSHIVCRYHMTVMAGIGVMSHTNTFSQGRVSGLPVYEGDTGGVLDRWHYDEVLDTLTPLTPNWEVATAPEGWTAPAEDALGAPVASLSWDNQEVYYDQTSDLYVAYTTNGALIGVVEAASGMPDRSNALSGADFDIANYTKVSGLSYTPEGGFNTADGVIEIISITVMDQETSVVVLDGQEIPITVTPVNDAPIAYDDFYRVRLLLARRLRLMRRCCWRTTMTRMVIL